MRLPKLPRIVWVLLIGTGIAALTVSAHWATKGALYPVALTTKEIVSLYKVPIDRQPAQKLEWSFAWSKYVRAVVEQQDDPNGPWKEIRSFASFGTTRHATLVYKLGEFERQPGGTGYYRILDLSLGEEERLLGVLKAQRSAGSGTVLNFPGAEFHSASNHIDPDRVYQITSGNRSYRIRLERSDQPFRAH